MVIKGTKINLDQVCSIKTHPKTPCRHYQYREEKRFLFWLWDKAGYFYLYTIHPYAITEEEIKEQNENLYAENKVVYFKPHVELRMSNGHVHEKYFNTVVDLENFMNSAEIRSIKLIDKK